MPLLSVEEVFYLAFPIVCLLIGRSRWLLVLLAVFVFAGPFARTILAQKNDVWQEYSYLGGMDAIALGCVTAIIESRLSISRRGLVALQSIGFALLIFVLGFSKTVESLGLDRSGLDMTILALGTCLIITGAARGIWRVPAGIRPLLWIGQHSYEVYLTHMFVVIGLFVVFTKFGKPLGGVPVLFVCSIILSGVLGEIVARFYTEPMNRLLRLRIGIERFTTGHLETNVR